jgi:drug/metabolite transporter (DMT)-like permease
VPAIRELPLSPVTSLLIGASLWGVIWYPMRLLEAQGLAGIWLTLVLYGVALVVSLPYTHKAIAEFARSPGHAALLMLAAGWTNIAFVEAVLGGNILRVLLLFYLSPLWAVILGWLILRERPSRAAIASLLIAMSGALLMLWDTRLGFPWPGSAPDWYALSSGLAFAFSNVITRKARHLSLSAKSLGVWGGVVVLAATIILSGPIAVPQISLQTFLVAAVLGVAGILLMTTLVQHGVTHMPVHRSAVISLIELVAGAVSQQLLTNEVVTVRELAGGVLIVIGAYLSARTTYA